jgi:hypothetical protein
MLGEGNRPRKEEISVMYNRMRQAISDLADRGGIPRHRLFD